MTHRRDERADLQKAPEEIEQALPARVQPGRLDVSGVLALQRAGGNRAVTAMIARNGTKTVDLAALAAAGKFDEAVTAAQGLKDTELPAKLGALDYDQIAAFCLQADRMLPGAQAVRVAAEPIRVRKHAAAYAAAVSGSNWTRAATLANVFNETDLMAKLGELKTAGKLTDMDAAAVAAVPSIGPRVHRHISFILHGPGPAADKSTYTVDTAGTEKSKDKAGGGDVRAIANTKEHTTGPGNASVTAFELEYKGAKAATTHWLQFISRAVWGEKTGQPNAFVNATVASTAVHSYPLTTDLTAPSWNTDSADATTPFYHARGVSQRDATRNAMADGMSARTDYVARAFQAGAERVVSQATFATYLVRDMDVLYRYDITVKWTFERATHWDNAAGSVKSTPEPVMTPTGSSASALAPDHRARLVLDYPNFDYVP